MTNRPFPGPEFSVSERPRNHLLLVAAVNAVALAMIALLIYRVADASAPIAAQSVVQIEVTKLVIATNTPTLTPAPTQTARIEYRAATNTPTPPVLVCEVAGDGDVCLRLPPSPTPTGLPVLCRELTPLSYQVQVCRKGDGATSAKGETG